MAHVDGDDVELPEQHGEAPSPAGEWAAHAVAGWLMERRRTAPRVRRPVAPGNNSDDEGATVDDYLEA
eukprot:11321526-Alexandrium_andersonii.AAC.1